MKKMLAMLLAVALLLSAAPTVFAADTFSDVTRDKWYFGSVETCNYHGWMNGVGDGKFDPNASMTRAMLVTVLHRAVGSPKAEGAHPFSDVAAGKYYSDAVAWAYENGVVKGVSDTEFAPNKNISRQELVTVFYRYSETIEWDEVSESADISGYADVSDVSGWAKDAFAWAVGAKIVNGVTENTLVPRGDATRAQCAKILVAYMDWTVDMDWDLAFYYTKAESFNYPTPESFGSVLTQEDLDELEQYARDYAYETYGYDGNPYCLPENGAGYFPATKWNITDLDRFYALMRECVEAQYNMDLDARVIWENKEDGSVYRRPINVVIEPLGKDYYRVHTYYAGHCDPFHQDYWKDPEEPAPHEHEWYPSHMQYGEDGVTPEYIVWLCRGCDEEQLEEYVPYPGETEDTEHEHQWKFSRYNGAEDIDDDPKWVVYKCEICGEEKFEDFATDPEWGLGGQ